MLIGTALIIDDNSDTRDRLAQAMKAAGHRVLVAGSGSEAMALMSTTRPHVILVDLDLPGPDPFDLVRQLRNESTDATLVALSGNHDTTRVVRAMRAGASDFIVKPVSVEAVQALVRGAVERNGASASAEPMPAPGEADRGSLDLDLLFRNSQRMRAVENIVRRAADTNATILLQGESGTGKEMIAKAIHAISPRRDKPFLKVNCASLPGELLESELFGHEKGSFTGAHRRKPGKFELAHRGTFLLDEIGEMPLSLQAKLLHVLQDGTFFRVGGSELISTDVRLIAATNKDLAAVIAQGLFREDLYYRLNVVTIFVPPLRERREEIPVLLDHFLGRFCQQYGRDLPRVSPETMTLLREYHWPGNVRELENMTKRLVVLQNEELLREEITLRRRSPFAAPAAPAPEPVPQPAAPAPPPSTELGLKEIARRAAREAEKVALKEVLERVRWNRAEAARLLKISYKALLYKIAAAGLDGRGDRKAKGKETPQ
jgi:two-component system response regulator AtoC